MSEAHAASTVLATEGLSKSFGGLQAVQDVALRLDACELHAVIGPNGAGKSTLVNLLSGELRPSAGRIHLDGHDITALPAHARAHAGIARSFQRTNIFKPLAVIENVRLAVQAIATSPRQLLSATSGATALVDRATAALERVGFTDGYDRIAGTLSHGEQRQLEIAMALASEPKVLLLDEPLAGMGPEEGERMALLLKSLARVQAVLLIEHDMDFVFRVADRMTVLVEGRVIASGRPADVRDNPLVQSAYLGAPA